jgi:mRNA interferase MazF
MPRRGDVWLVDFDPSVGAEMRKVRPVVVLSRDRVGLLPLRVVVPLTHWKPHRSRYPWFVPIPATAANGLNKDSGADAFQVKSVSEMRFTRYLGVVSAQELVAVAKAVAYVVGAP